MNVNHCPYHQCPEPAILYRAETLTLWKHDAENSEGCLFGLPNQRMVLRDGTSSRSANGGNEEDMDLCIMLRRFPPQRPKTPEDFALEVVAESPTMRMIPEMMSSQDRGEHRRKMFSSGAFYPSFFFFLRYGKRFSVVLMC